jgi:hypothetical protein
VPGVAPGVAPGEIAPNNCDTANYDFGPLGDFGDNDDLFDEEIETNRRTSPTYHPADEIFGEALDETPSFTSLPANAVEVKGSYTAWRNASRIGNQDQSRPVVLIPKRYLTLAKRTKAN